MIYAAPLRVCAFIIHLLLNKLSEKPFFGCDGVRAEAAALGIWGKYQLRRQLRTLLGDALAVESESVVKAVDYEAEHLRIAALAYLR